MTAFHRGLAAGSPVSQSLNEARVALLRDREPVLASPSAWAAFVLIGDPGITVGTR
jgi:CHAT domain-containing protein